MIKLATRLAGLVLSLVLIVAAADFLIDRADEKFTESGSYRTEILAWEQCGESSAALTLLGNRFELDLGALRSLNERAKSGISELFTSIRAHVTPEGTTQSTTSE